MKKYLLACQLIMLTFVVAHSQNIFNATDPIVRYKSNSQFGSVENPDPTRPGLQKWVSIALPSLGFDGSSYKAYFSNLHGKPMAFRLKFPKSFNNPDSAGKKYPVTVLFHGAGEVACPTNGGLYNNEKHLTFGGNIFKTRVDNNQYDGFVFFPQLSTTDSSCTALWGTSNSGYYMSVISVIDSLAKHARADIDRVFTTGLSAGGIAAWKIADLYPQRIAGTAPSAAAGAYNYSRFVHIPIWLSNGGMDTNPSPTSAQNTIDNFRNLGGNLRHTFFPSDGHFVWNKHWGISDYPAFMNSVHKANPLIFFQKNEFCPDSAVSAKIGITPGFYAYEWQKDLVTIATSTNGSQNIVPGSPVVSFSGNEMEVNAFGSYRVRFKRTALADWSVYSPIPAAIKIKAPTKTPAIQVAGSFSKVLPSPDGSTTVPLRLPSGQARYEWVRTSDNTIVSTDSVYTASIGQYKARYWEVYNCGATFSPNFNVVNAAGTQKPSAASNVSAIANSTSSVNLTWTDFPNPTYNESNYEIYRSTSSGGPYVLIRITNSNVVSYQDNNLVQNTNYFYVVRAINNSGASSLSNEASAITQIGNTAPVIGALANAVVKTGETHISNFNVTDSATDVVTVSIENRPAFVTLQKISETSYRITAVPGSSNIGVHTIKVIAADNKGAQSSRSFILTVTDGSATTVLLNFGASGKSALSPWNNWLGSRSANSTISNLKDQNGVATSISVTALQSWSGTTDLGHITGNNSGIYPDAVLQSGITDANPNRQFRISGLNSSMKYNLVFTGSQNEGLDAVSRYTSGVQTALMDARYNTTKNANLNGLTPDANGEIMVDVSLVSASLVNYLSAMLIEEYPASINVQAPANLFAETADRTSIKITWSDRSALENTLDGFQLQRATDSAFSENLVLVNLPRNAVTYTATSLEPNTKYWFRIRSKTNTEFSEFSNREYAITPEKVVYVNFNSAVASQPAPWNNTVANPISSHTFSNLKDHTGANSGISIRLEKFFNGEFNAGMRTGNNSGVVPDNVLQANYWLDKNQQGQMKVSGLNRAKKYRFGFTGSSGPNGWFKGNYTATYSINTQTVYLNSWSNTTKMVYINEVTPDETGSVFLNFSTTSTAAYGFNAGVVIEAFDVISSSVPGEGQPPVADAGADQTIKEPASTAPLSGINSTDPDGTIVKYEWTKVSGDAAAWIEKPTASGTRLRSLKAGTYVIRLKVTDNNNLSSTDDKTVIVLRSDGTAVDPVEPTPQPQPEPEPEPEPEPDPVPEEPTPPADGTNIAPVARAGNDAGMNAPANSAALQGDQSSDADGSIVKYEWKIISGPAGAWIEKPALANTRIRSLVVGSYVIRLTVTDDKNASATDDKIITVAPPRTNTLAIMETQEIDISDIRLTMFPNPAQNTVNLRLSNDVTGKGSINIYDNSGKLARKISLIKNQRMIQQSIDISSMRRGVYVVEVVFNNQTRQVSGFVKQ